MGGGALPRLLHTLRTILAVPFYRRLALVIGAVYLVLFLVALQDISLGGRRYQLLTTDWTRMFDRSGAITFEAIAQVTVPGLTILLSPLNILIGLVLAGLAGLNLTVTWMALRQPKACRFNRSTGVLASVPALLAGSACCAPAIILILGLQVSSLFITVFQVLIPVSALLLLVTLAVILHRTDTALIAEPR
ncbi:MAG: hypothetical protein KY466_16995 [Gemmatimonadetes bacterium]|nr:hypothetical protein [Gemmatimonadota bacterium]